LERYDSGGFPMHQRPAWSSAGGSSSSVGAEGVGFHRETGRKDTTDASGSQEKGEGARVIASKFEERGLLGGSLDREQLGAVLHEHPL